MTEKEIRSLLAECSGGDLLSIIGWASLELAQLGAGEEAVAAVQKSVENAKRFPRVVVAKAYEYVPPPGPVQLRDDLAAPPGLDEDGTRAHAAIVKFLRDTGRTYTGGCRAFYSPKEWAERGERYGRESVLVVCHDGGDLAPLCNYDYGSHASMDALVHGLEKEGFFVEACTTWYSAVYRK